MSSRKKDCARLERLLLDEPAGLSPEDQAFKAAHLAACAACKRELAALEALSLEKSPGPTRPLHDLGRHRLVTRLVAAVEDRLEKDSSVRERVQAAAATWDRGGRPPGLLFRGPELDAACRWYDDCAPALEPVEEAFLAESSRNAARARARRRLVVGGSLCLMAVVTVFALVISITTHRASQRARHRARVAEKQARLESRRSARETARARQAARMLEAQAAAAQTLARTAAALDQVLAAHQKETEAWAGLATPQPEAEKRRERLREALSRVRRERRRARLFSRRAEMAVRRADRSARAARAARQAVRHARRELLRYQRREQRLLARKRALRSRIITALPGGEVDL